MVIKNKVIAFLTVCLLLLSTFAVLSRNFITQAQGGAELTGNVADSGKDTDGNGKYDYLEVSVEINVSAAGTYRIYAYSLMDQYSLTLYLYAENTSTLGMGLQWLNLSFFGPVIHNAQFNPNRVQWIDLYEEMDDGSLSYIDGIMTVSLSHIYNYADFDAMANFTGRVFDRGVDKNSDGLFDYLEVSVEITVTEPSNFTLSANGLKGMKDGSLTYVYDYQSSDIELGAGLHVVNLTFSGSMIAYNHLNPTNVTGIDLIAQPGYYLLNYTSELDLPTKYNYSQFNPPINDIELEFMVHPNATIDVNGKINKANTYPRNDGLTYNTTVTFSTSGNMTTGSANGRMELPPEAATMWPYNALTANLLANYSNGMLNTLLNASLFMPPEALDECPFNSTSGNLALDATYSNGVAYVDLSGVGQLCPKMAADFPFNMSDLRLLINYKDNEINGNITFRVLGGFPLGDVIVHFNGNKTQISANGYVNVTYGSFFGDPIDASNVTDFIEHIHNMTGRGEGSAYNITDSMIELVSVDTVRTNVAYGEVIDYNATLSGNFTGAIAKLISGMFPYPSYEPVLYAGLDTVFSSIQNGTLRLNYYNGSKIVDFELHAYSDVPELWNRAIELVPPIAPEGDERVQVEAMLKIANASAYAIKNAHVQATYSGDEQKLDLTASLSANVTQLKGDIMQFIPNASLSVMPPEFGDLFKSFANVTYCELDTMDLAANFANGAGEFQAEWTLQGDLKAQTNHCKWFIVDFLNATNPGTADWSMRLINATDVDINNSTFDLKQGTDWMTATFDGVKIYPAKDGIDPIRFKLSRWLNLTNDPEAPPQEFDKLKITITSGFNGTHTILLFAPDTVPNPNTASLDYKTMMWQNVTMSSLQDLLFQIAYQEVIQRAGNTYYVPIFTNSTVANFDFSASGKSLSFNVSGSGGTGFSKITIPKALLNANLSDWVVQLDGRVLTSGEYNVTENSGYAFIYLNYSHSTHMIKVEGTWVVAEFPPNLLPLALMIVSIIAALIAVRQRKRLSALRTKYQSALHEFALRLHQART